MSDIDLISTWSDFGMNYRGRWVPTNVYKTNDVVWVDLKEPKLNGESYFICQEEHQAILLEELSCKELWRKYQ